MNSENRSPSTRLWLLAIVSAAFAVYAPSLGNGFAGDDMIAQPVRPDGVVNPMIAELQGVDVYFDAHYWQGMAGTSRLYRPVTILGYALTHQLAGGAAWAHHLGNVLLHCLATVLVFRMLRALRFADGPALVGTAVFALHAIHSEVVAAIVGRAELLAFVCGAGALLLFCRALDGVRTAASAAGAAVLLFLAYGSKESGLSWAAYLPLFAWIRPLRPARGARRAVLLWLLVAVLPAALFLLLRARMIAGLPDEVPIVSFVANPLYHVDPWTRLATATMLLGYGLWKLLAPLGLCSDYGAEVFVLVESAGDVRFLAAAGVLAALGAVAAVRARREPLLLLAVVTFFAFVFVTSNLPLAIGTIFGERLYYAPSLAVAIAAAWAAGAEAVSRVRRVAVIGLGLWLAASSLSILERNPVWRDTESLFASDVVRQPRSIRLLCGAADLAIVAGEIARANVLLDEAARLQPGQSHIHALRAKIAERAGDPVAAELHLRRALTAEHYEPLAAGHDYHHRLAVALAQQERRSEALAELQRGLAIRPGYLPALQALLRLGIGELDEGVLLDAVRRGQRLDPRDAFWTIAAGHIALEGGRPREAEAAFRTVLRSLPTHGEAAFGLGKSLAAQGQRDAAVDVFDALSTRAQFPAELRERAAAELRALR